MLGKPGELWVLPGASKDLGVASRDHASTLTLERTGDDSSAATSIP